MTHSARHAATDDELHAYADLVGQTLVAGALPPLAGRLWGWLLICDPPEQTAEQLATALHASRGSISGMARLLENAGLVARRRRRGDRKERFVIEPGAMLHLFEGRQALLTQVRRISEQGLELLGDKPPPLRVRLQELHDLYAFMEREMPGLLDRFRAQQGLPSRTA